MKPGLAASVASLARREELARPADTGIFISRVMRSRISRTYFSGDVSRQTHAVHRGEIEEAFVNRNWHQRRRIFLQHAEHFPRDVAVGIVMRPAQDSARTNPLRLKARHAGLDTEIFRRRVGRNHYAVAAPPAADPHGAAPQFLIERDFAARKKLSPSTCKIRFIFVSSQPRCRGALSTIGDMRFTRPAQIAATLANRKSKTVRACLRRL